MSTYGNLLQGTLSHLLGGQTAHVGRPDEVREVLRQVAYVGVDGHLVLPLKLSPHLAELGISARGRHDVVHDVDVDIVQHHTVTVAGRTTHVIHCR